jgi:O-antigen ligase
MPATMAKRKRAPSAGRQARQKEAPAAPGRVGTRIGIAALCFALFSTAFVVDTGADSAFDSPKRLFCLVLIAVAAAALALGRPRWLLSRQSPLFARLSFWLVAAALALAGVSALLSPRQTLALDALRAVVLYVLLLPIGASQIVERGKAVLLATFLGVSAVNAVVSILQWKGLYQPFKLLTESVRESTGAFVGNVGYLSLTLALAAIGALAVVLTQRGAARTLAAASLVPYLASLFINRNLTALSALAVGVTALLFAHYGRRALPSVAAAFVILIIGVGLSPMRQRAVGIWAAASARDWNAVTTYRFGAWKAASLMAQERPLVGFGPGTFGAEYVPHRLAAEITAKKRYVNPMLSSSYGEAHCDYLQLFGEMGFPAGFATLTAVAFLFGSLIGRLRRMEPPARNEVEFLIAFLSAGATGALTWFPLQRPVTALPLLLAAGRAWRVCALQEAPRAESDSRRNPAFLAAGLLAALLLARAAWPELPRHAGERALRHVSEGLRYVLRHPTQVGDPQQFLNDLAARARAAATVLPGDPRPWVLAGGAYLVKGDPGLALELYRTALRNGERSETDLNMGRAREGMGQPEEAHRAFLRSAWVNPGLLYAMLPDAADPVRKEVLDLEGKLRLGQLREPPPAPD